MDSSVWFAAADTKDAGNARAKGLLSGAESLVTSDHVLVETWMLLRRRLGGDTAERFWDALRRGAAAIEPVTAADIEVAWAIGERYPDQGFSIVDRTSFAVMQRLGLDRVATFDHHFAVYRHGPRRDRAFTVLP
ncbi:MAG: PIN domain-containing protein [Thermoleophilia bacterium]|nr:PIN domain-containing protein [Thermoleophilia bacterium]